MQRTNTRTRRAEGTSTRRRGTRTVPHAEAAGPQLAARGSGTSGQLHAGRRWRPGGTEGNEILTIAAALVLVLLLAAEGITIVHMQGLLSAHMFIGLVLIPPVTLKLGSTGYRMVSYYTGSRAYRLKGPPALALRLLAPVLVASMIAVLASGVLLLTAGHKSNVLLTAHKASFLVFGVVLAVHVLAYVPRVLRSSHTDWTAARRQAVPGAGARAMLVAAALGGGVALALALLPSIQTYGAH
jgi:hypothetical protein